MSKIIRTILFAATILASAICHAAESAFVTRAKNIAPDTYVDFPIVPDEALSVVISNATYSPSPFIVNASKHANGANAPTLGLRRYRGKCALYVSGEEVASCDDIWDGDVDINASTNAIPSEKGDVFEQKLAPFAFADSFMVAPGDASGLGNWEILHGDWTLHAATGRMIRATEKITLTRFPTQERSPNFYCLNAFGKDAVITAGESFHSHYSIKAALQQNAGTNGIAFLLNDDGQGYTFTAQSNEKSGRLDFILRKKCIPGETCGEFIAGVKTELTPGQWYTLEARLTDNEIICYVDNIPVIRTRQELRAGGYFGLYANTLEAEPARFDDVFAGTWTGTDLSLDATYARKNHASFGATNDPPPAISIEADISGGHSIALRAGGASMDSAAYTMLCSAPDKGRKGVVVQLISRIDGITITNDFWANPSFFSNKEDKRHEFTLDATIDGLVAGRIDGHTVVLAPAKIPATGIAGYDTDIPERALAKSIGVPSIRRTPEAYTDQFEKNKLFVIDPFMRHWASTAGQWITYTNIAWYKDDVLNRVALDLPAIDGIDLRLGVGEDTEDGDVRIVCKSNTLALSTSNVTNGTPLFTLAYQPAKVLDANGTLSATNSLSIRYDGNRIAVMAPTGCLFTCEVPFPHSGRKMLFKSFPTNYLGNVIVKREPVLDCLFSESLHDWIINGGTWEVINRFQCYPEWSHMDGENPESVAALWSKYEIEGDFAVMFICGMRHGWYENVGDFNLSVMGDAMSPSRGYTLSVAGWEPNLSQKWSRLFRNGELLAKSDVYASPRRRNGNKRLGYEPLLAQGRDVHGAWYSIKFRKLGDKLEAFFDNRQLLSATDPSPLANGGIGIWTYKSSMVVARVRITADAIRPRAFKFEQITEPVPASEEQHVDSAPSLRFNGLPIELLRDDLWYANDDVSCPEITFEEDDGERVMTVTSTHGSGSFLVTPDLPAVTADALAGWSFEIARSERANVNFEFSCSNETARTAYSYVISGSDETKGPRAVAGKMEVPEPTPQNARHKVWTPVKVWIPATGAKPSSHFVRLDGFGNLQPSEVQQGLHGNAPGEWYSIRRLHPIFRGMPSADNETDNVKAFSKQIRNALDDGSDGKLNEYRIPSSISPTRPMLLWTLPPADNQGLIASVVGEPDNLIRVSSSLEWPNHLICTDSVKVNETDVPHAFIRDNVLNIPFVRPFDPTATQYTKVSFKTTDGRPFTQMLQSNAFKKASDKDTPVPVITSVTFPQASLASYVNFESRDTKLNPYGQSMQLQKLNFDDPVQSTYLRFFCNGPHDHLRGSICQRFSFITSPLVQFRYRGDEFSRVKFNVRSGVFYKFGDSSVGSKDNMTHNDEWHTMVVNFSAVDHERRQMMLFDNPTVPLYFNSLGIGGYSGNYNGPYSYLDFDEIAVGPCIGKDNTQHLSFMPRFDITQNVARAEYALSDGLAPYDALDEETAKSIRWTPFDPATTNMIAPSLEGLSDGPHHLFIRAVSPSGSASRVADIPFIYDVTPPAVNISVSTNDPSLYNGTTLKTIVHAGKDQAPISFTNVKVTANGENLKLREPLSGKCDVAKSNDMRFEMNWPFAARSVIQKSKDGDVITFITSGIADGAGNIAPPTTNSIKIEYASDHTPPTHLMPMRATTFHGNGNITSADSFFNAFGGATECKFDTGIGHGCLTLKVKGNPNPNSPQSYQASYEFRSQNWIAPTNRWLMLRVRIPEGAPVPEKNAFSLRLTVAQLPRGIKNPPANSTFTLDVPTSTSTNQTQLLPGLYGTTDFQPGKWVELALDANEFLCKKSGVDSFAFRVTRMQLMLPPVKNFALDIDAAVIMKDIADINKTLSFNAYDASGIDGIFMRGAKIFDEWTFTSKALYEKCDGSIFPEIKLRDRAGNFSSNSIIVPLPPRQQ